MTCSETYYAYDISVPNIERTVRCPINAGWYDPRYEEWLGDQGISECFRWLVTRDKITYAFANERDALLFKLTWS